MAYFIRSNFADIYAAGGDPYYIGDRAGSADLEVPPRPSSEHKWDGASWAVDPEKVRARKVAETKAEAFRRILALVPGWTEANHERKQRNALMRSARLLRAKINGTITAEGTAEMDALDAASDLVEADIAVSADPASFDVATSTRWPV